MAKSFNFSVLCKTIAQVKTVLNSNENYGNYFSYKKGYIYWFSTCLGSALCDLDEGDYGYEFKSKNVWDGDGDIEEYERALFKNGHSVLVTFEINEDGKIFDWKWTDYLGSYDYITKHPEYFQTLINFDDFDILLDKISSGNLNKISKNLITRCKTTEVLSPIEIIKIDKNNQEDKYKKEIKELEELIDTSFIKDNGAFINIEGHGYTKSIRKKLITCIEIKGKEVSKEEEDYFECKAGEFLGNEVLIHINGKTEPIKIYFSTIVYWPKYEDDLAKRFYNKLMNDINWD